MSTAPVRALNLSLLLLLVCVTSACGDRSVSPSVAAITPSPSQMADARRFREAFGLQADDEWIARVANDPSSKQGLVQFAVPLLPSELTDLVARTRAYTDAGPLILNYAATVPDDWYGWYIDQQRGGIIVVQFFRNADRHRAALAMLLPTKTRWEVVEVSQRTLDMIAFVARVKADRAWFASIDAELLDVLTSPLDGGVVELTYLAARRDLDQVITDHYGSPEWLRVARAGGPPWTGPVGDLVVRAVNLAGNPIAGLTCGLGEPPMLTDRDGICRYHDLAAVALRVELWSGVEESRHVVGGTTVSIKPNATTTVRIVVSQP